jgi:hypothetical protein
MEVLIVTFETIMTATMWKKARPRWCLQRSPGSWNNEKSFISTYNLLNHRISGGLVFIESCEQKSILALCVILLVPLVFQRD